MAFSPLTSTACGTLTALLVLNLSSVLVGQESELPERELREPDIVAGLPHHRSRIDDYIARVAAEDFDQLVDGLSAHEDLLVRIGARSSDLYVEPMFQECLANRRLARIFEHLSSLSDATAAESAEAIFVQKLEEAQKEWLRWIDALKADRLQEEKPFLVENVADGLSAAVFLSAEFCEPKDVLEQIDQWEAAAERVRRSLPEEGQPEGLEFYVSAKFFPQRLFLFNVYANMILDHSPAEDGNTILRGTVPVPGGVVVRKVPFIAWDGHTNPFDFTSQAAGVPPDVGRTLKVYEVVHSWQSGGVTTQERRQAAALAMRQKLASCLGL